MNNSLFLADKFAERAILINKTINLFKEDFLSGAELHLILDLILYDSKKLWIIPASIEDSLGNFRMSLAFYNPNEIERLESWELYWDSWLFQLSTEFQAKILTPFINKS